MCYVVIRLPNVVPVLRYHVVDLVHTFPRLLTKLTDKTVGRTAVGVLAQQYTTTCHTVFVGSAGPRTARSHTHYATGRKLQYLDGDSITHFSD